MEKKIRYHFLDELRGFAVFCMVFYHGFFTMADCFSWKIGAVLFKFFMPAEPFFAALFVGLSGVCCSFSRNNLKRGLQLAAISIAVTGVTAALGYMNITVPIWFGILHILALSMIIVGLFYRYVKKMPKAFSAVVAILLFLLFLLTFNAQNGFLGFGNLSINLPKSLYNNDYLFWLGFPAPWFSSGDYFPVLPWLFLFICGAFSGNFKEYFPHFFTVRHIRPLAFLGRHALIVYILHQPIIYGLCFVIFKLIGLFR